MNKELLTFEYIDKFKGLLIILIVAGHINGLTSEKVQIILYSFHISSFFFLPFLFNNDKLIFKNIIKIFKRYYIPYTVFFIISCIAYTVVLHNPINLSETFIFWITGTQSSVREASGIGAYWFFPALIALLTTIMFYNLFSNFWKKIFIIFSFFSHLLIGFLTYSSDVFKNIPFDIYIPLYLFFLGFIVKNIINTIKLEEKLLIVITIIFIFSLILFYQNTEMFDLATPYFPSILTNPMYFILHDFIMLSGFFSILYITRFIPYIAPFGKYSIAIYTLHPLINQTINLVLHTETFLMALLKFFIIFGLAFLFSLIIYKLNINKLIYPK
jgi:fucose 4-O-acetylase-like acetyltransferase